MCKHVAATLYGVGARLDTQPELLFKLRGVDPLALIASAGSANLGDASALSAQHQQLDNADLSALFGIDLGGAPLVDLVDVVAVVDVAPAVALKTAEKAAAVAKAKAKPKVVLKSELKAISKTKKGANIVAPTEVARVKKAFAATKVTNTVTRQDLLTAGASSGEVSAWLGQGLMFATDRRGVYEVTPAWKKKMGRAWTKLVAK